MTTNDKMNLFSKYRRQKHYWELLANFEICQDLPDREYFELKDEAFKAFKKAERAWKEAEGIAYV